MKKFLLSIAVAATLGLTANATKVTFDFVTESYGLERKQGSVQDGFLNPGTEIKSGAVTITFNGNEVTSNSGPWRLWTDGLRAYYKQSPSFTVSVDGYNVTGVEWTYAQSGIEFALKGSDKAIKAWGGNEQTVTFECIGGSANRAFTQLVVYYDQTFTPEEQVTPEAPEGTINVASALQLMSEGYEGAATVEGYVISITEVSLDYGNATYTIADKVDDTSGLLVFRGKGLNGASITSQYDIEVGGFAVVTGELVNYSGTYEFTQGSSLVEYTAPANSQKPENPTPEPEVEEWNVAQALAQIKEGFTGNAIVTGIISDISEISTQYGNATYTIKDALTDTEGLLVYRGYYLEGEKFTSEDQLTVGDTVKVSGKLVDYNGTLEFTTGSSILSVTPAGIEGIAADNAPAVYYNLQGVRVNNPEKGGLYIIRQGNKSVKAIIR
ncbi:MAG: hypothetical protein J1F38_01080 [Muribaculaceae bacterium]|nr:hypothetical protein [Muribaculaceae bacterium]